MAKIFTKQGLGETGITVDHMGADPTAYHEYCREGQQYLTPPPSTPRSKRKEAKVDVFEEPIKKTTRDQDARLKRARENDLKQRNIK